MSYTSRASGWLANQLKADDTALGASVAREYRGGVITADGRDIGGGLRSYPLMTAKERDAEEAIRAYTRAVDSATTPESKLLTAIAKKPGSEEIALAQNKAATWRLWDRESYIMDKIEAKRGGGKTFVAATSYGSGVPERKLEALKAIQDKQLMLAKIKLQGGMGMNEEEWNLLYSVEGEPGSSMSDFAPESIHLLPHKDSPLPLTPGDRRMDAINPRV